MQVRGTGSRNGRGKDKGIVMTDLATPLLEVDKIEIVEGHNPRTHMNPDALKRLAGSLGKNEMVQPLTVRPIDGGKFAVVAGHRRLEAAKLAGIKEVPVHVRKNGNARSAALAENLHREGLDPIDTAHAIEELAAELKLTTNKEIAEEIDLSDSWVSQHRRLLKLPEGVQSYIAAGDAPVDAERDLRTIAKVSPRIAECVCELAKRKKVKGKDFLGSFDELLVETAGAAFEDKPTMIDPEAALLSDVVTDKKMARELGERYLAAKPYVHTDNPTLRFSEAEVDAARAAGCLLEYKVDHGEWTSTLEFITDAEFAADLAERAVDRIEAEAAAQKKKDEEWEARRKGLDPDLTPEQRKEAMKDQREEKKERATEARSWNERVGRALLKLRGGPSRKEHELARFRALVAIVLLDNPSLPARGLRLVTDQLKKVEVKQLKTTGESREKITYADPSQCLEYLNKRLEGVSSVKEGLELFGDAVIAALLADEEELPQSKRVGGGIRGVHLQEVEKILRANIKAVRPRRQRRKSGK